MPAAEPGGSTRLPGPLSKLPWKRLGNLRDYGVVLCLIGLCAYLTASTDTFLTEQNLHNLLDQSTSVGIIACAGTLVIIAGGFDLSVGAIYAFVGVLTAKLAGSLDPGFALLIGLAGGLACGVFNGALVSRGRINPFVVTLASGIIFGGIAVAMANGTTYTATSHLFETIGRDKFLGILWSSWIFLVFALVMGFVLQRTVLGRHIYAVGGNREAAR
ncbi:MAG TPA: ABC transporter permease, partial [Solirubrobacterales bacterium]